MFQFFKLTIRRRRPRCPGSAYQGVNGGRYGIFEGKYGIHGGKYCFYVGKYGAYGGVHGMCGGKYGLNGGKYGYHQSLIGTDLTCEGTQNSHINQISLLQAGLLFRIKVHISHFSSIRLHS